MSAKRCVYSIMRPVKCGDNGWELTCTKGQSSTCTTSCTDSCPLYQTNILARENVPNLPVKAEVVQVASVPLASVTAQSSPKLARVTTTPRIAVKKGCNCGSSTRYSAIRR
jgi:hypothetical protein